MATRLSLSEKTVTEKKKHLPSPRKKLANPMKSIRTASTAIRNSKKHEKEPFVIEQLSPKGEQNEIEPIETKDVTVRKKSKKKTNKRSKRKVERPTERLRTFTESTVEIQRVLEKPPEYKKTKRLPTPHDSFVTLAKQLFTAMDIDRQTRTQLLNTIREDYSMKCLSRKQMCSLDSILSIEDMAKTIAKLTATQYSHQAALIIETAFRRYKAIKTKERIERDWNQNRVDALASLIKREKTYVLNLATVVSQYVMPLRVSSDKQFKDIAGDLKLIFSNLEHILSVHQNFLDSLYTLSETDWPQLRGLGNLFIDISPHWKAYGIYVHNFQLSRDILFECMNKSEKFVQFLDERTLTLSTDLNMLLSLPLNHIAGYELILKKFLNETEEGSDEQSSILQALILTEETSNFIANSLGKSANVAKIENVNRTVLDLPPNITLEISKPGCEFIKEVKIDFTTPNIKKLYNGSLFLLSHVAILGQHTNRGCVFKHCYDLEELSVIESDVNPQGFQLLIIDEERPAYDNIVAGSQYDILLPAMTSREQLIADLKLLISKNQRTRTFGVELEYILEREKSDIPRVVVDLIEYLESHALEDVGLFRIPGTSTVVKKLRFEYNQAFVTGVYPQLDQIPGFGNNDAAGLLKMFFHDLPEPLIPFNMFNSFLESQTHYPTPEGKLHRLTELIQQLPDANYRVLQYLVQFMVLVVANNEVNKMGAENLAMCFGPNILQPAEQTIESTLSIPKTNGCIALMIKYFDSIFTLA